ncbi:nitric oxide reductase activation protein NorD [Roseateles sp. LKC17W]|uniref:Nitric oxide reductase activation protein NorD n=1 Tax=Pelomonas margarita TaxID=3299031 RepID=A0ABW7FBQ6_9BURK
MEAWIGEHWHRFITGRADSGHAQAAQHFAAQQRALTLLLRAAGGRQRLALAQPMPAAGPVPRSWLQRLAGSGLRLPLPQIDTDVLALPARLALHADPQLNMALYRWWPVLAAHLGNEAGYCAAQRAATQRALRQFPGLQRPWRQLLAAELEQRGPAQGPDEQLLRAWLDLDAPLPGAEPALHHVAPLWCWLQPVASPPLPLDDAEPGTGASQAATPIAGRRRARTPPPQTASRHPLLLAAKTEWLKTFADPLPLDRAHDDTPEPADAQAAADSLDTLTLQRGGSGSRLRFDLDLPAGAYDDIPLGPPEALPEWDPRRQCLQSRRVSLQRLAPRAPAAWPVPPALRALAAQLRRRLAIQQAALRWQRGRQDGEALDLDAWVHERAEPPAQARGAVYQRLRRQQRELATLLLADLSMSTDAHANDHQRVIDVIRDSLYVFGEALQGSGDPFALLGFSSVRRLLRLHEIKSFDDRWDSRVHDRLGALQPGYYTRTGAALRAATRVLQQRPERQRLLLLLSDGKPHDLDGYDGRLGLEDTREALREARAVGLTPFLLSIDSEPPAQLAPLFGTHAHAWVRRPTELPQRLLHLHAQLLR